MLVGHFHDITEETDGKFGYYSVSLFLLYVSALGCIYTIGLLIHDKWNKSILDKVQKGRKSSIARKSFMMWCKLILYIKQLNFISLLTFNLMNLNIINYKICIYSIYIRIYLSEWSIYRILSLVQEILIYFNNYLLQIMQ